MKLTTISAIFSILTFLPLPSSSPAIELTGHRIKNVGGRCTWACIETAGRAIGLTKLHGFAYAQPNPQPGHTATVRKLLTALNVRFVLEDDYVYNLDHFTTYANSHGVIVTIMAGSDFVDFSSCHSILVKDYGEQVVEYFDPNHPLESRSVSRAKFDKFWSGNAIVILPD